MSRKAIEGSEIVVNVEGRARESSHRAAVVKVIHVHVSGLAAKGKIRISFDDSSASHQESVRQCKFAALHDMYMFPSQAGDIQAETPKFAEIESGPHSDYVQILEMAKLSKLQ